MFINLRIYVPLFAATNKMVLVLFSKILIEVK